MKQTVKKIVMVSMLACIACTSIFAKGKKDKAAQEPTAVETETTVIIDTENTK